MKFTPGIAMADFSGSVGSTTASRNRFGPYLRTKAIPVNPNTTRQQAIRSAFGTMVNRWVGTLTAAQRQGWNQFASNVPILGKDGSPINITGQNFYVRVNSARQQAGFALVDDSPESFNNGNPVTSIELVSAGTADEIGISMAETDLAIKANIAGGALENGDVTCFIGPPINDTRNFFKGPFQLAAVEAVATDDVSVNFTTVFTSLLSDNGTPAAGQYRAVRFRVHSDVGQLSEPYTILAPVTADSA